MKLTKHKWLTRAASLTFVLALLLSLTLPASAAGAALEMSTTYPGKSAKAGDSLSYAIDLYNGTDSGYSYDLVKVFSGCVDVAAANQNTIALKADGSLYIWGTNGSCQMGLPAKELEYAATPRYITNGVKAIDAGMGE